MKLCGALIGIMSVAFTVSGRAQGSDWSAVEGLRYAISMQGSGSGGEATPLWLNANKYGLSSLEDGNGYLRASLARPLEVDSCRKFGLGYTVDLVGAVNYTSAFIVQQAFVEGRWLKGVLTIGSKEYPMELKNQKLSTGSQTLGINARPVPQIRIALPDYWDPPFLKGWVGIKGHIAYGRFTDDNWQTDFTNRQSSYTEDVLYHSKAGYLRIGNPKPGKHFSIELGLEMASQFGGTTYEVSGNGTVTVYKHNTGFSAYWDALVPGGSDTTEDEYKNVEGNQLGSWVMRVNFDYPSWYAGLYADHYFEDHSGMFLLDYDGYGEGDDWDEREDNKYHLYDLKDIMLGLEVQLKQFKPLNNIVVEYLYTKYQSGAVYHDHTEEISDHLGGIDNYYNHSLYNAWQHWGQVMGNPLYLSPIYNSDGEITVKDNRFVAWHLGLAGEPANCLSYRFLATYRKGYGTYGEPYEDPHKNLSLLAETSYSFPCYSKLRGWSLTGAVGVDVGHWVGNNYGFQLTVMKSGLMKIKKKNDSKKKTTSKKK